MFVEDLGLVFEPSLFPPSKERRMHSDECTIGGGGVGKR